MAKIASPPLYNDGKPYFWRHPPIATKFPHLGSHQGGGEAPPHHHHVQGRRRGKGPPCPRAGAALGSRRGAASPPRRGAASPPRHGLLSPMGRPIFITIYCKIPSSPTVISWQTWCMMQYIIFPWSIVWLCWCLSSELLWQLWSSLFWLHTSICYLLWWSWCTNIWVHTYVGGCTRLSPLHDDRRRDKRSLTETESQFLDMHVVLIHG